VKTAAALLVLAALPLSAGAQQEAAGKYFQGLTLVDQDGRAVDLYEDVMKGHVVVINSFFTECKGSCPVMAGTLGHLQKRFEGELGQTLRLISISADPERDTPEKLKAYAARMGAKGGWTFLTGTRAQVDAALTRLGQYAARPDAHTNVMIVGNLRTGLWKKAMGLAKREEIASVVQSVLEDR
jgi:protein SCO1/2